MGYGAAQDRVLATSLKKFEQLKPLYRQQKRRSDSLALANTGLHRTIVYQKVALRRADSIIVDKDVLYLDSDAKYRVAQKKASGRGWTIAGLSLLSLLLGVAAVR